MSCELPTMLFGSSAAQVFLTAYVDAPWSRPIHAVVTLICLIAPVPAGISVLRYCEHVAAAQARRGLRPAPESGET